MGVFFSVERLDLGFYPQRPLFGVPLPPPLLSLFQNFLEAGVGEVDRSLQPAPGGDPQPGSGDAWSWANSGWGNNEGSAFVSGQSVGKKSGKS